MNSYRQLVAAFFIGVLSIGLAHAEAWTPDPKFDIEGTSYKETLIFISGMSYALTDVNKSISAAGSDSFLCNAPEIIGNKLVIEILNEKHTGTITSEDAIATVMSGLRNKFSCEK